MVNIDSKRGSVGFTSVLFPSVYPVSIIRLDEAAEPVRGPNGLCVPCRPGEPGEFVGKIVKNHPSRGFDGYVDKTATDSKIIKDVLRKGDSYFRSGDLLYADEFGWMYFMDRMGDTFRWRGENVSTIEVESVISSVLEQTASVVYGVDVPGVEGKAGMAAIVEDAAKFDLDRFLSNLKAELPSYAIPLFLRVVRNLDITGGFIPPQSPPNSIFQGRSKSARWIWCGRGSTPRWWRTPSTSSTPPWAGTAPSTPASTRRSSA